MPDALQRAVQMTMSPDECERYLRDDIDKWANVVKTAKIKVD